MLLTSQVQSILEHAPIEATSSRSGYIFRFRSLTREKTAMTAKKARSKRGRPGAVKQSRSRKKTVRHSAIKKSSRKASNFEKVPPVRVVIGSTAPLSPYAAQALRVFTAGVQRALKEFAELNIPAVVMENGRLIKAVPTKVGGRYVVVDPQGRQSDRRSTNARKRNVRLG